MTHCQSWQATPADPGRTARQAPAVTCCGADPVLRAGTASWRHSAHGRDGFEQISQYRPGQPAQAGFAAGARDLWFLRN